MSYRPTNLNHNRPPFSPANHGVGEYPGMEFGTQQWDGWASQGPAQAQQGRLGNGMFKEPELWKRREMQGNMFGGGGRERERERVGDRGQNMRPAFDGPHDPAPLLSFHHDPAARLPPPPPAPPLLSPPAHSAHSHFPSPEAYPASAQAPASTAPAPILHNTLWWGDLEPWMDEEYAKQVCALMGWDAASNNGEGVSVRIPQPPDGSPYPNHANNPGYCLLTFPSYQHAAAVLAKLRDGTARSASMPNSNRPFNLNWASSVTPASIPASATGHGPHGHAAASPPIRDHMSQQSKPQGQGPPGPTAKEYSIFVGDLAPEASNSDLLAVFRNPILGLRSDRAPKCVRPFYSCKSAKIMLDPTTGVSKGYGFVRFTDQAEQQRALIEMHGLYCLSRPMRVSPATAKYKPASPPLPPSSSASYMSSLPSLSLPSEQSISSSESQSFDSGRDKSVSAPLAGSEEAAPKANPTVDPTQDLTFFTQLTNPNATASVTDDSGWSAPENAQARQILANLIGPNGEQLTSADPYNTTVFVGGLSPLISEDTLRTFFAPFGDIHYVKVPVGKHCGFVQFVRKADAQRAIERMQGFPIGGSRIRLSWGRSQYKAAQAVVQQAQQHAIQAAENRRPASEVASPPPGPMSNQSGNVPITREQLQYLQQAAYNGGYPHENNGYDVRDVNGGGGYAPYRDMHSPVDSYGRGSFSPFEHHHSLSDPANGHHGSHQQPFYPPHQQQPFGNANAGFNRAPGFGPSPSLPANMKISPLKLSPAPSSRDRDNGSGHGSSPPSSEGNRSAIAYHPSEETRTSPPRTSPFGQYFDGHNGNNTNIGRNPANQGAYIPVADALRKDSQALPPSMLRANSAVSIKKAPSPEQQAIESDIHDLNGSLKTLSIGGGPMSRNGSRTMMATEVEEGMVGMKRNGNSSPPSSLGSY